MSNAVYSYADPAPPSEPLLTLDDVVAAAKRVITLEDALYPRPGGGPTVDERAEQRIKRELHEHAIQELRWKTERYYRETYSR